MPTKIVQRLLTPSVVMEAELSKLYSQGWSLLCAPVPIGEQMALVRDVFLHTKRPPDDELIPKPFLLFLFSKEQTD